MERRNLPCTTNTNTPATFQIQKNGRKLLNGEDVRYDARWLKRKIQESYDEGRLQAGQYDHLIGLLEEVEF